jgi:hypothetical protein
MTPNRTITLLSVTMCVLTTTFVIGSLFIPGFSGAQTMAFGTGIGALGTLIATLAGITWGRASKNNGNGDK